MEVESQLQDGEKHWFSSSNDLTRITDGPCLTSL
jgi:hypothetical protein